MRIASGRDGTGRGAGFSLLEVMVAGFILFVIIGITARILSSGQTLLGSIAVQDEAEIKAADLVDQIAIRLRNGCILTLQDGAGAPIADGQTVTNGVTLRLISDYKGEVIPGETIRYTLVPDESDVTDNVDNDKDNYVDESYCRMQRWPDGDTAAPPMQDVRLPRNVQKWSITRTGRRVTILAKVERYDPYNRQLLSVQTQAVWDIRN